MKNTGAHNIKHDRFSFGHDQRTKRFLMTQITHQIKFIKANISNRLFSTKDNAQIFTTMDIEKKKYIFISNGCPEPLE